MSLIGTEIGELRDMNKALMDGSIDHKQAILRLKVYTATAERCKMILDIHKLATLKGLSIGKITKSGLFSADEVLPGQAVEFESELLSCPSFDNPITLGQCLDWSGEAKNFDECRSCEYFKKTRGKLLQGN